MKLLTDAVLDDVKKTLECNEDLEYREAKLQNEIKYFNEELDETKKKLSLSEDKCTQIEITLKQG